MSAEELPTDQLLTADLPSHSSARQTVSENISLTNKTYTAVLDPGSSQLHDKNVGLHQGPHLLLLLRPVQQGWPSGGTAGRLGDFPEISSQEQRTFPLLLQDSCLYKVNIEHFHILLDLKQVLKQKFQRVTF